jgi:hypothetical protein
MGRPNGCAPYDEAIQTMRESGTIGIYDARGITPDANGLVPAAQSDFSAEQWAFSMQDLELDYDNYSGGYQGMRPKDANFCAVPATVYMRLPVRIGQGADELAARSAARAIVAHDESLGKAAEYASRSDMLAAVRCDTVPFKRVAADTVLRRIFAGHPSVTCHFADPTTVHAFAVEHAKLQGDSAIVTIRLMRFTPIHGMIESIRAYVLRHSDGHWALVSHRSVLLSHP